MGGGLESRCVGRVCPSKPRCRKPYAEPTSNAPDDGRMYAKHVELRIQ